MDGSSATRASSSSSTQQTQQAPQPQRTPTKETIRSPAPVVGKPFAGILAASFGHRAGAAPLAGLRGRPSPTGASLANAARRAAGGAAPGAASGASAKRKPGDEGEDETDPDARGTKAEVHQVKADDKSRDARDLDLLDPATRQAAMLAPPLIQTAPLSPAAHAAAEAPLRARTMEELLPALVKRIAWAGDKNRGTVHLELGAGAYAGTKITVHADAGKVRVELAGQEGPDLDRLRTRLDERLRGHGLDVESVT